MLISVAQFTVRNQQYSTELGACYYIEVSGEWRVEGDDRLIMPAFLQICLIFLNLLLTVLSYLSYKRAKRSNFPIQRNPYEISTENYGYVYDIEVSDKNYQIWLFSQNV